MSFAWLCCPPRQSAWRYRHPRVFLAPDHKGMAKCPYCGEKYSALDDNPKR
ncbi:MAG: zinc-finger domain-containing protein [Burkholderiales bacterium]|nr:zinc-finger domain-containing protein [Burkholderiales bacterium]